MTRGGSFWESKAFGLMFIIINNYIIIVIIIVIIINWVLCVQVRDQWSDSEIHWAAAGRDTQGSALQGSLRQHGHYRRHSALSSRPAEWLLVSTPNKHILNNRIKGPNSLTDWHTVLLLLVRGSTRYLGR